MPGRKRPPTSWMKSCTEKVAKASRVSPAIAQKICAGNWWHRMSDEAKLRAVAKHEPEAIGRAVDELGGLSLWPGAPEPKRSRAPSSSRPVMNHGYMRLPAGANHQHGPGPRRCPKCGV